MEGNVSRFNVKRGYGFIQSEQLENEIFVHITSVEGRRALRPGQRVVFDQSETEKGPAAVNVRLQGADESSSDQSQPLSRRGIYLAIGGAAAVLIALGYLLF